MKLHFLQGYIQNIYLAEYRHGLLLLDGCCRADIELIRDFILNELKRPFTDLQLVVVTHMHPDHAGAAAKLRSLTGCRLVTGKAKGNWYKGVSGKINQLIDLALAHWVAGRLNKPRKWLYFSRRLRADAYLDDGEKLPDFEEWQVVNTPGHTDRDISLLHIPSNKIYVADLIVTVKGRFIPPFPVSYPNQYQQSVIHVRSLTPTAILLAHGGEVQLTVEDYQHLIAQSPQKPKTTWRTSKVKIARMLGLQQTR